jgi:hypothetical protein
MMSIYAQMNMAQWCSGHGLRFAWRSSRVRLPAHPKMLQST